MIKVNCHHIEDVQDGTCVLLEIVFKSKLVFTKSWLPLHSYCEKKSGNNRLIHDWTCHFANITNTSFCMVKRLRVPPSKQANTTDIILEEFSITWSHDLPELSESVTLWKYQLISLSNHNRHKIYHVTQCFPYDPARFWSFYWPGGLCLKL